MEKSDCIMNGKVYASGQSVCTYADCHICENGEWKSRGLDFLYVVGP